MYVILIPRWVLRKENAQCDRILIGEERKHEIKIDGVGMQEISSPTTVNDQDHDSSSENCAVTFQGGC